MLCLGVTAGLCFWASQGARVSDQPAIEERQERKRNQTRPDAAGRGLASPAHGMPAAQHSTGTASAHDRWQLLPWLCLGLLVLSAMAFAVLHQLTLDLPGATRDMVLLPPVFLCVLWWLVAAVIAVIGFLRSLLIKPGENRSRGVTSPVLAGVVCALLFPVWMLALILVLQTGTGGH